MMVEDDNFAQTWYAFWVLPLVFILLNLFMIPRYPTTLQTGRVLQVYIVMSIALLFLMLFFNAIFLLMAISINRNARLQQENQFLSMQQQRYESLKAAIEEARQARHDMRHQMNQLSALAEAGDLDGLKAYLAKTVSRIPELDMSFCENRAADSVVGYYCALAKREGIPFCAKLDLPQTLPVDEIDMCLVLSNLLENAFEASLRTAPARRKIEVTAYVHAARLVLIETENAFDGKINEIAEFSARPSARETASESSPSAISQKNPAGQVRLPIRTVCSAQRSCFVDNYVQPFQNGTTTNFSSLASGNPCMYRIAVFAKMLDVVVFQSASFTISLCRSQSQTAARPIRRRCPPDTGRQRRLFFVPFAALGLFQRHGMDHTASPASSAVLRATSCFSFNSGTDTVRPSTWRAHSRTAPVFRPHPPAAGQNFRFERHSFLPT